jgi:sugar lactone lactonase YvrE
VNQYDVAEDGSLSNARAFITGLTNPDSMCLDAAGNVYIGVSTGLQIVRSDGSRVALIRVRSSNGTTNCGFGGPDGKTLFIAAWNVVMQLDNAPIPGLDWQRNQQIPCN